MVYCHPKPCRCGSGLLDRELKDAAGIFCCYVCDKCETSKRADYNPAIFTHGTAYSVTGEEADLIEFCGDKRRRWRL